YGCGSDGGEVFWDDFWLNTVNYNGTNLWQDMANFEKVVINRVDDSPNVVGYGILNEPHFWQSSHYTESHAFHDFMYNELREATDKDLFVVRETGQGGFNRIVANQHFLFPAVADNGGNPTFGLVYEPHHYDRTTFSQQITNVN